MPDTNPKVVAMVERALKKDAQLKSTNLKERAAKIDKSVGKLSGRQFHARYVIQVRKRLFGGTSKKRRRRTRGHGGQAKSRDTGSSFLQATFEQRKAELDAAVEDAFQRALASDSVKQVDAVLASLEQHTADFARL